MNDLLTRYNYDSFIPEKFEPWMNFESSPKTGTMAHDFALWNLDKTETRLSGIWSQYDYTIVEFGSFT
ncbi:MAG: hypothetical protein AUJ21_00380 [Anaerolineae bacterium CG1_02_58_13]|nr:MAG: hypothetical protein AUJ21_00380 [Anaerolineae bacterium CG1_02_58_13]